MRNNSGGQRSHSTGNWVLILLTGAIIGGLIGNWLASLALPPGVLPYLRGWDWPLISGNGVTIDLYVLKVNVGVLFRLNMMSIVGVLLAALAARKV